MFSQRNLSVPWNSSVENIKNAEKLTNPYFKIRISILFHLCSDAIKDDLLNKQTPRETATSGSGDTD